MKKLMYAIVVAACLTGCKVTDNAKELSYSKAHGYFVRNDAPENAPEYYDSKESFDSIFGMAAVMGKEGMPSDIDFSRQSVIAVIGKETNRPTEYVPVSLTAQADTLRLEYQSDEGTATSYTMVPSLLLIIEKPKNMPYVTLRKCGDNGPSSR